MAFNDRGAVTDNPSGIMNKLKIETLDHHSRLESLPYFNSLIAHKLPLECYVAQLKALYVLHAVLEHGLATSEDPVLKAIWDDDLRKLPLLEKDIEFFKPRINQDADAPTQIALAMTEKIRLRQAENPIALSGYLYVFEGSTLGNNMHRPDISATYMLEELNGCKYYSSYREQVQDHWNSFSMIMNQTLSDSSCHGLVIEAAHEAFKGLHDLYSSLYPLEKSKTSYRVTSINPEAGNHPVPNDEREIKAALSASDRGWAEFPYYEQRYGSRGKKFSDSDTCWLATLILMDQEPLQKQIDWLCRLLAARGMPSIMLERTLRFLEQELSQAIPDNHINYQKLTVSADHIKIRRQAYIDDANMQRLASDFEQELGVEISGQYQNLGILLVSAVTDEMSGIKGAVESILRWITDEERFSTDLIRNVKKTIAKAENQASQHT